ncbi:ketoacyl-ACP synthase III [Rickettsiaceae bacterium]|nr:ketoacyl-ACP synthase III [Rickettsiaceae bacterium]
MASKIIGVGGYLPKKILTNTDLEKIVNTSDEWIATRTGISQRHVASEDEACSNMALCAAKAAIDDANITADDVDLIITCTTTPDHSFPAVANKIQGALFSGRKTIPSFDLQAVCSGFVYGMQTADSMIKSGKYKTALIVCADKMSSLLDWNDRKTCVLFGDGAGAVILQQSNTDSGIIDSDIYSDGSLYDTLHTDGGVSTNGKSGTIQMNGQLVFKNAIEKMSESVKAILKANDMDISDIDYLIPHQANLRIINNIASRFDLPQEKIITTVQKHANCSAASIPLALAELKSKSIIEPGKILVFTAFGAGATWGSILVRW